MAKLNNIKATTELEAVNAILGAIGEAPIDDLDSSTLPDVATAVEILKETMRETLSEGWRFNTRFNPTITSTTSVAQDGETFYTFPVPDSVLKFDAGGSVVVFPSEIHTPVGTPVFYDVDRDTELFPTNTLTFRRIVYFRTWDQLPETARQYILKVATNEFIQRVVGSQTLSSFSERDILRALRFLVRDQGIRDRYNIFNSGGLSDLLGGRV